MLESNVAEYPFIKYQNRQNRSITNREMLTIRALLSKSKYPEIFISIGTTICSLIKFEPRDRINFFLHRTDKNIILLKKSINETGNRLIGNSKNFYRISFTLPFIENNIKLSQTISCDYEIEKENQILINISKIKWKI